MILIKTSSLSILTTTSVNVGDVGLYLHKVIFTYQQLSHPITFTDIGLPNDRKVSEGVVVSYNHL